MPEAFQPPKGTSTSASAVERLIFTIPAGTSAPNRTIRSGEVLKRAAASPGGTPATRFIAWFQSSARWTTRTGPKVSSWTISASGSSQQMIVGGYQGRSGEPDGGD